MKKEIPDIKLYGLASCLELVKKRPRAVLRLFVRDDLKKLFKLPYKVVTNQELERLTDSVHHEGVCVCIAKPKPKLLADISLRGPILFLDHPLNPHNLGAIVRSAAHFNIGVILSPLGAGLPPSGFRIAKGGAEYVEIAHYKNRKEAVDALKTQGYRIYATSPHLGTSLKDIEFVAKSAIVLGGESSGISDELLSLADEKITIKGSGFVESLNVSNAFCLIASRCYES